MKAYDSMWAALTASRISTLEELIHIAANNERLNGGEAVLLSNGSSDPAPPSPDQPPSAPRIFHRYPSVPLALDGKLLQDPEELSAYNGQPLYYTPVRSKAGLALAAFTSRSAMFSEIKTTQARLSEVAVQPLAEHICTNNPDSLGEQACFFEHIGEQGDVRCLPPNRAYRDLTRVGRTKVAWWYTSDWNDVISSVSWCRWDVSLYEHVNYGGSQLWLPAGCNTPNLVELGWNDRASAIVNWGRRF